MTVCEFLEWFKETGLNPEYTDIYIDEGPFIPIVGVESAYFDSGQAILKEKELQF